QLCRIAVEVYHVARFLGGHRPGIHGDANIGLSQSGRIIRTVSRHGNKTAFGRSFLMYSSLSLGVACARKSSTPASDAIAAAVNGLSPVIMTERIPIARNDASLSFMPPFTMSFR